MNRRTFLQLVALAALDPTKARPDRANPARTLPHDEGDDDFLRDVAEGRARWIGTLSPTAEVVLSTGPTRRGTQVARVSTMEDWIDAKITEEGNPRCVRASVRSPTVVIISPTPYRVTLIPGDDRRLDLTMFIALVRLVRLRVYLRPYGGVDVAALIEEGLGPTNPLDPP
jgi:hypothetical protein